LDKPLIPPGGEAMRKAVGDNYTVMLDSTWSYRYEEALRVGRPIEEMGFYWYEDPLADQDIYNYVKLKQKLEIPILATEFPIGGFDAYAPWILERATDFLRGDVAVKGGITTLIKTAHLAEAFRMNLEVHHGGNSLNNVANLHVIMAQTGGIGYPVRRACRGRGSRACPGPGSGVALFGRGSQLIGHVLQNGVPLAPSLVRREAPRMHGDARPARQSRKQAIDGRLQHRRVMRSCEDSPKASSITGSSAMTCRVNSRRTPSLTPQHLHEPVREEDNHRC
jgi:hypothetical protein